MMTYASFLIRGLSVRMQNKGGSITLRIRVYSTLTAALAATKNKILNEHWEERRKENASTLSSNETKHNKSKKPRILIRQWRMKACRPSAAISTDRFGRAMHRPQTAQPYLTVRHPV